MLTFSANNVYELRDDIVAWLNRQRAERKGDAKVAAALNSIIFTIQHAKLEITDDLDRPPVEALASE